MSYKKDVLSTDDIKKDLPPPMIPLDELIQCDTWLNIPYCLVLAQKHQQNYVINHDTLLKKLNDKVISSMYHAEVNVNKHKIEFKEEA